MTQDVNLFKILNLLLPVLLSRNLLNFNIPMVYYKRTITINGIYHEKNCFFPNEFNKFKPLLIRCTNYFSAASDSTLLNISLREFHKRFIFNTVLSNNNVTLALNFFQFHSLPKPDPFPELQVPLMGLKPPLVPYYPERKRYPNFVSDPNT